jgi:hypothetical protein
MDDHQKRRQQMLQYKPESWRDEEDALPTVERHRESYRFSRLHRSHPDVRDQTRVLELLGRINYKIISGNRVYIEVGGVVYKTLYGGYWRSVFTGVEHYLLRCEQVSGSIWAEDSSADTAVDLPIVYSNDGWTAKGHSLSFMLSRD